jgi:hypothetical protein
MATDLLNEQSSTAVSSIKMALCAALDDHPSTWSSALEMPGRAYKMSSLPSDGMMLSADRSHHPYAPLEMQPRNSNETCATCTPYSIHEPSAVKFLAAACTYICTPSNYNVDVAPPSKTGLKKMF